MIGFGEVLKRLRAQHGISQRELGERIGLDFTYISKIENGSMPPPSEDKLLAMEKVFGVDKYNMVLMAGKVPTDFQTIILNDKEVQDYLHQKMKESEYDDKGMQ